MKDPAFLFYPSDFLTGTMAMPFDERGRYITLLCYQHQAGRMSEETIRFLVGSFSDTLRLKFSRDENGLFYNSRLEEEIDKRNKFLESRRNNGSLGGRPKKEEKPLGKPNGKPKQNLGENRDINENEVIILPVLNIEFETFWKEYDKKVGDKSKLEKKWRNLTDKERQDAIWYIPMYKQCQPDKKYRKNPETFLNNKSWNDELIQSNDRQQTFTGHTQKQKAGISDSYKQSVLNRLQHPGGN